MRECTASSTTYSVGYRNKLHNCIKICRGQAGLKEENIDFDIASVQGNNVCLKRIPLTVNGVRGRRAKMDIEVALG